MITGVMRGYVRDSRLRNAERLPVLMISLSAYSSLTSSGVTGDPRNQVHRDRAMFRPNDGYAAEINKYSRTHDGPNAQRALGMMKRREGRGMATGEAMVIVSASWHTQHIHKALGRGPRRKRCVPPPAGRGDDRAPLSCWRFGEGQGR